jgi:predicted RNase H-like HicB family nuclease
MRFVMKDTVEIRVEVTEDEEHGTVYVATNDPLGIVADGTSFEELLDNLSEVLALCMEDTETVTQHQLTSNPRVIIPYSANS